jgi:RimJ/RimL family protein N-acetyltransferase
LTIAPSQFRTSRLIIRRWQASDAEALAPVLAANVDHLAPWIPWRVAEPVPPAQLAVRLNEFAAAFDADREWRYAVVAADANRILGDVDLFPRNESGRVPFDAADRVEMGYWLRADATGQGYATEAARAALEIVRSLPRISRVMIRCDERNHASAAIPRRLGFRLVRTVPEAGVRRDEPDCRLQEWEYDLDSPPHSS